MGSRVRSRHSELSLIGQEFCFPDGCDGLVFEACTVSLHRDHNGCRVCLGAIEEAIRKCGQPGFMNTDQGSQSTSLAFTQLLSDKGTRISMDGGSAWRDNVFVERLW